MNITFGDSMDFTEAQNNLYAVVVKHPGLTSADYAAITGKSRKNVKNLLGMLKRVNALTKDNYPIMTNSESSAAKLSGGDDEKFVTTEYSGDLTIDSIYNMFAIDRALWEVVEIIGNQYGDKKQLKVKMKRREADPVEVAISRFADRIAEYAPVNETHNHTFGCGGVLLEVSLFDHHFGKLSWSPETGDNYDLKIAKKLYKEAVRDILTRATAAHRIDKILFPVGQDLFHINNHFSTTEAGTFQDTDSRLIKIFDVVQETLIEVIEDMRKVAPVDLLWVGENHGPMNSYFIMRVLNAYYSKTPDVTVDIVPKTRKYYRYGSTLIGFSHGDKEKMDNLAFIMANEAPMDWALTTFREFHIGHFHKKMEKRYFTGDSHGSVTLRVLPSLCGTDAWHYQKGYVKTRKFCESYVYDFEHGPIMVLMHNKGETNE